MQNQMRISKTVNSKLTKVCLLVAANVLATVNTIMAQSGEPSTDAMKNAAKEAAKSLKEQAAHDEIMGYVYMVIGFGLVIGIAWFTNVKVQKRRNEEAAQKAAARHHHHPHDPHRRTHPVQHKRPATRVN
jgi:RNA 3'-terminal phosphate cyclase